MNIYYVISARQGNFSLQLHRDGGVQFFKCYSERVWLWTVLTVSTWRFGVLHSRYRHRQIWLVAAFKAFCIQVTNNSCGSVKFGSIRQHQKRTTVQTTFYQLSLFCFVYIMSWLVLLTIGGFSSPQEVLKQHSLITINYFAYFFKSGNPTNPKVHCMILGLGVWPCRDGVTTFHWSATVGMLHFSNHILWLFFFFLLPRVLSICYSLHFQNFQLGSGQNTIFSPG